MSFTSLLKWPVTSVMYARIVESYPGRDMTHPTTILIAFQSISQVLHAIVMEN